MDSLPPGLLCDIIDLAATAQSPAYKPHLSPYAAVSENWQQLIESKQFSCIRINNADIDTFASVFGDEMNCKHRRAALQQLFLRVYSPTRPTKPRSESTIEERRDEVAANDTVFSKSLQSLFSALQSWSLGNSLDLYLFVPTRDSNGLFACRTEPRILALESLPRVGCVGKFVSRGQMTLPTETLVGIASSLPNLRHVDWQIADGDGRPALLIQRRQNRYDFANQLLGLKTSCPKLTTLELAFSSPLPGRNPITEVPSVLLPYTSIDHLCVTLRRLCQSLQRVVLTNLPISTQLFWPYQDDEEADEDEPFWPNLTHFDLEFSVCAAEGGLWADSPSSSCSCRAGPTNTPDEKHQTERPSRMSELTSPTWPSEELEGLFLVIAKAISRMPMLQSFRARVGKSSYFDSEDQGFAMHYTSPIEGEIGSDGTTLTKHLYWNAPPEWRMSTTLEEHWRSILGDTGMVNSGKALLDVLLEWAELLIGGYMNPNKLRRAGIHSNWIFNMRWVPADVAISSGLLALMRDLQQYAVRIANVPRMERGHVRSQVLQWLADYKDNETDPVQLGKLRLGKLTGDYSKRIGG